MQAQNAWPVGGCGVKVFGARPPQRGTTCLFAADGDGYTMLRLEIPPLEHRRQGAAAGEAVVTKGKTIAGGEALPFSWRSLRLRECSVRSLPQVSREADKDESKACCRRGCALWRCGNVLHVKWRPRARFPAKTMRSLRVIAGGFQLSRVTEQQPKSHWHVRVTRLCWVF